MKGLIFSVKKYSIHDGPGIRVTFFMKGCPLHCLWCHNPEGMCPSVENVTITQKIGDREFSSSVEAGRYYTPGDIPGILEKERIFMEQSGGGVTFSGGEPLFQSMFLLEVLKLCKKEGYKTAVDTSGYSSAKNFNSIIPYTDIFLFDIKHLDDKQHINLTGVSNKSILDNYKLLTESGNDLFLRIPIIPGYNDDRDHLERLRTYISSTKTSSLKKINLLPFHKTGSSKYERFDIPYLLSAIEPPSNERMMELKSFFEVSGVKVKIGG